MRRSKDRPKFEKEISSPKIDGPVAKKKKKAVKKTKAQDEPEKEKRKLPEVASRMFLQPKRELQRC